MNTRTRAEALALALSGCGSVVPTTADDLIALVQAELGHPLALDEFFPHAGHQSRAFAPETILHIVAGNTPAAGLQTIVRGLLLGSYNLVKLPREGLAEVEAFVDRLSAELSQRVKLARELAPEWLESADTVIVFGSDETISEFRERVRPDQRLVAHGHRLSFGVVFDDPSCVTAAAAAHDVAEFDQLGCLSPHVFYVAPDARAYAAALAASLAPLGGAEPPLSVKNVIRGLREEFQFRAANGEPCAVWQSEGSTAWTVLYDEAPGFPASPLHRTIFVKPLPADLPAELALVRMHLSCAGIQPATPEHAAHVATLGVSRICPIGRMQEPPWTWHQDGAPTLASLVRWVDFESPAPPP